MLRYTNLWEDWSLTNTNSVHSVFNSLWPSLLDASGNCQRPVIILTSVSLHNASHNKPVKNIYSIGHQSCKRMMKEKTSLLQKLIVCFQMPKKGLQAWGFLSSHSNILVRNYTSFSKTIRNFRRSRFSQCFNHQQLFIARIASHFGVNI